MQHLLLLCLLLALLRVALVAQELLCNGKGRDKAVRKRLARCLQHIPNNSMHEQYHPIHHYVQVPCHVWKCSAASLAS